MGANGSMRTQLAGVMRADEGCAECGRDTALYVDGELGEGERIALELHVEECPECAGAVRYRQALRDKLRHREVLPPAPASLKSRVRSALDAEEPAHPRLLALRRLFRPVPVAATAGATALGITAWLWFGTPTDDIVREIVARHSRRLPLEIQSSDPQSLENWLSDKVDFRVKVPHLTGAPLALMGARLSHVRDHNAVYLLFGRPHSPAHRVSMLVYDDPSSKLPVSGNARRIEDRDVYMANAAGYNVAVWKQNEIVYSLVSDGDDDVMELVRAANR